MSDYTRIKALRIPFGDCHLGDASDYSDILYDLHSQFGDIFYWNEPNEGKFDIAPTSRLFLDYVLEYEYGADCGEWGKVRELYDQEKEKYAPIFHTVHPDINMDKVRLVEFCWYNGCEAPSYYDPIDDPFYQEIPLVPLSCSRKE